MISLTRLLEETSRFHPNLVVHKGEVHDYENLILLEKGQRDFSANILYIGLASVVAKQVNSIENATFLLVRDCCLSYNTNTPRNRMIVEYPFGTDPFELFNVLKAHFYEKLDLLNHSSLLFNSLLKSSNLDELVETSAQLLKNPVLIMDLSYKVLSYSKLLKIEDGLWLQTIEMGSFTDEYIEAIHRFNTSEVIPKDKRPYHLKPNMTPTRWLINSLNLNRVHFGYFLTLEANASFGEIDLELYMRISDGVAKTIKSDKAIQIHKEYMSIESILVDLIEENISSKSIFLKIIRTMKLVQGSIYKIICIKMSNNRHKGVSDNYQHSLEGIFPRVWSFQHKEDLIILIDLKRRDIISVQDQVLLELFLDKNGLFAGASDVFTDLYLLAQYYHQAVRTLDIAKFLLTPGTFFEYDNFKFYDMALSAKKINGKDENRLKNYRSSIHLNIQAYDNNHATEYLKTLWTYLNCNKNLSKTAQKLFIHKNTAANRIRKLEELFGIDMNNDFQLFMQYYSYLLSSCMDY